LSFETFVGRTWIDENGPHEIAKALEEMSKLMRGWGARLNAGLRVATDKDMAERNRHAMEHFEEQTRLMKERAAAEDDPDAGDDTSEDEQQAA
jgi:hypothetical protein